jgi:crotonobetainyl-CoA:carnitine CoA-transferase CaiB-like acyl-CoA transferase
LSQGPLAGLRVICLEQYGAGPFGSMFLADMGADVVRIEDPREGGDVSRYIPPAQKGDSSLFFESFNRGKRSLMLNIKNDAGRQILLELLAGADILYSNLRGDVLPSLRLTFSDLVDVNPMLVVVSLTGYGTGEDAGRPGYDALVQGEAGWAFLTGDPSGPPVKTGLSLADYCAGLVSAFAALAAVHAARRSGQGADVSVNLYDTALSMLTYPATWLLSAAIATDRQPLSAHPSVVPFQFFETNDGFLAVACPKERFFRALITEMKLEGLGTDGRFTNFRERQLNRSALVQILAPVFRTAGTEEWIRRLEGKVPVAPVRSIDKALDPIELERRGMLAEWDHPSLGHVRTVGSPIRVSGYNTEYRRGPLLDEDRDHVMSELGYSVDDVARLVGAGAFAATSAATGD